MGKNVCILEASYSTAEIAQLGERQTEDLKVPGSIPGLGICAHYSQIVFSIARTTAVDGLAQFPYAIYDGVVV